jgi:uncharacterized membrane protein YfcA
MTWDVRSVLLFALGAVALAFSAFAFVRMRRLRDAWPSPWLLAVGFVTDFFDTLGIGSYATTAALWRARRSVDDRLLPGTLNVGHAWPTFVQAGIFLASVDVEATTLVALLGAASLGAWLGSGLAARLSRRAVRLVVGSGLAIAAVLMSAGLAKLLPMGGDALGLAGVKLVVAIVACALFGALMTFGIGAYAPIMLTVSLLGMNPTGAFPIMMGACAFLMPVANVRFLEAEAYDARAAIGLTVGGVPGVLVAAWVVKSLPLVALKVLVVIVASGTAVGLLRDAWREPRDAVS